ncbi:MAG: NAD-dependent epimerase/dehydratase family protein [Chitinophagaceae bacterium]
MKKAILIGGSGFVGSYLLQELLSNPDYEEVKIIVRKNLNINHPKLKALLGDYHTLSNLKEDIKADDVFIAIGTTKNKEPDQEKYYQIDHDYPVLLSKLSKETGAKSVFIVTSVGANANSSVFYLRTKGETERDIIGLDFEHTHIFRPSMIMGTRKEFRPTEKLIIKLWSGVNFILIGKYLKKYKGIDGPSIAKAINNAAKLQTEKVKFYHWQEMNDLL